MNNYLDLLRDVLENGKDHADRTGTGRRTVVGRRLKFDLSKGFPIVTTRKVDPDLAIKELLWIIKGSDNADLLKLSGVGFWDKWKVTKNHIVSLVGKMKLADRKDRDQLYAELDEKMGSIGPIYGSHWRDIPTASINTLMPKVAIKDIPKDKLHRYYSMYDAAVSDGEDTNGIDRDTFAQYSYSASIDQFNTLLINLRDRPFSSRLVVNSWIPEDIPDETISPQENVMLGKGALAPCHCMYQCIVSPGDPKVLNMVLYIRSSDVTVGLPHNIIQYATLLHMLARHSDMDVGELIINLGDAHIYFDQLHLVPEQISRDPFPLSTLILNMEPGGIYDTTIDDISIKGYHFYDPIRYPVST